MVVLLRMEEKKTNGTEQSGRHRKQKKRRISLHFMTTKKEQ
jgi:hypothetical protein